MIDKIKKEICYFENLKGVQPNALILGIGVINELLSIGQLNADARTEKNYVCGCEVLIVDYCNTENIKAVLI